MVQSPSADTTHQPLLDTMMASLRRLWDNAQGYQRLAYLVGAALIAVGLIHAGMGALTGESVSGPLSWRKPATFGISFGVTTATLGWVALYLPVRRGIGWVLSGLLCATITFEVGWVTVQHARGVPSHFNNATPLDEALFIMGAIAISVTILVIIATTVAAFTTTTAPRPMAWAIRSGLLALLVAQASGLWMLMHGLSLLDDGVDPLTESMSTYGVTGMMKFAHAVPMHAIQVLGVLAWLLSYTGLPRRRQLRLVVMAMTGYAVLIGTVLVRTRAGLAPFDPLSASTLVYVLAFGLLAIPAVAATTGIYRHRAAVHSMDSP